MFGVSMILLAVITISIFCYDIISERDFVRPQSGYYSINKERYWDMVGFSFFMFEGIGSVMPVMNACDDRARANFPFLLAGALITLCSIYILFSELCYFTFGNNLNEAIVMQEMPSDSLIIQIVKLLYCLNLVFSYPLCIFPTNLVIDSIIFDDFLKLEPNTKKRLWAENVSRAVVCIMGVLLAVFLYDKLDKVIALSGTFLGTTVVLFIPATCHYKLVATSRFHGSNFQKGVDIFIIVYAFTALVVCSTTIF
jgi:amino acid permease